MHCICCDTLLSDFESTRKDSNTGEYLDMCNGCFYWSDLPSLVVVDEREDLLTIEELEDE